MVLMMALHRALLLCAVLLLCDVTSALLFGGPSATVLNVDRSLPDLKSTTAPSIEKAALLRRQYLDDPNLCGWSAGNSRLPDSCPVSDGTTSTCFPQDAGGLACCAQSCGTYTAPTACSDLSTVPDFLSESYQPYQEGMTTYCYGSAACNIKTYSLSLGQFYAAYCVVTRPDFAVILGSTTGSTFARSPSSRRPSEDTPSPSPSPNDDDDDNSNRGSSDDGSSSSERQTPEPVTITVSNDRGAETITSSSSSASSSSSSDDSSSSTSTTTSDTALAADASPSASSSTSTSSDSESPSSSSSSSPPTGPMIGGVLGGIAVLLLLGILAFLIWRHRRKQKLAAAAGGGGGPGETKDQDRGNASPPPSYGAPNGLYEKDAPFVADQGASGLATTAGGGGAGGGVGRPQQRTSTTPTATQHPPRHTRNAPSEVDGSRSTRREELELDGSTGYAMPGVPNSAREVEGSSPGAQGPRMTAKAVPESSPGYYYELQ